MGTREHNIESYLEQQVKALGGYIRKWVSINAPDRIIILKGKSYYVEVKTEDGKLSVGQKREHDRLRVAGASVHTVYGYPGVNTFIGMLKIQGSEWPKGKTNA